MREILVYDDYKIHKLGAGGGSQYEEVTTEKATRIDVTDVAKTKGKLLPFGRTTQNGEPTPDNPIPIENVEGRSCRNVFDFKKYCIDTGASVLQEDGFYLTNFNTLYSLYGTDESGIDLNFKENTQYTINFIATASGATGIGGKVIINYTDDTTSNVSIGNSDNNTVRTLVSAANKTIKSISFAYSNHRNDYIKDFQINEGSTALPYEPYFEGKRLEFNVCNKNIFDNKWELGIIRGDTGLNQDNANYIRSASFIPIKELTNYKISDINNIFDRMLVYEYKSDFSYNLTTNKVVYGYLTTEKDTAYIRIRPNVSTTDTSVKVQIEEATAASSYEEHKQQLIPFPLAEGQKLMEGDYLADDGIHHVMGQIELSGASAETWYKNTDYSTENMLVANLSANNITDIKSGTKNLKCSHFKYASPTIINSFRAIGNALGFGLDINSFADINEWKTWLQSNPIIVEYELKEEVIDSYTPAQAEAYNKLMNLMLYKGINHIWTNTDGLEPNLQLTYKRKKQEGVLQVSNIQPLNNLELNNTEETPEEITTEISEE